MENLSLTTETKLKSSILVNDQTLNQYSNMKDLLNNESKKASFKNINIILNNNISELNGIELSNISEEETYKLAITIMDKYNSKRIIKNSDNEIIIRNRDIDETIHKMFGNDYQKAFIKEHLLIFSKITKIITSSVIVNQNFENKGRKKYFAWHYYINFIQIGESFYLYEFDVVTRIDGENHFRVQRIVKLKE